MNTMLVELHYNYKFPEFSKVIYEIVHIFTKMLNHTGMSLERLALQNLLPFA